MTWRDVGNLRGEMGATGPQGATGDTGPAGAPFTIYRTYATIALMEADFANVPDGSFVAIQSNVEDPDNAKLYLRGNSEFTFITDMSGATGIHGDTGETGATGKAGAQILLRDGYRNSSLSSTECPARPTLYGGFYVADLLADNAWATEVNLGDWVITRSNYNLCHIACITDGKALVDEYWDLKGPKGDTGPAGPVNLVSTLDTVDTANAVTNSTIATAIESITNQIGTITAAQEANLTLLGS